MTQHSGNATLVRDLAPEILIGTKTIDNTSPDPEKLKSFRYSKHVSSYAAGYALIILIANVSDGNGYSCIIQNYTENKAPTLLQQYLPTNN